MLGQATSCSRVFLPLLQGRQHSPHLSARAKDMDEFTRLEKYQVLVDEAMIDSPLNVRQSKAAYILSEALKFLSRKEFQELQDYVFERLEK